MPLGDALKPFFIAYTLKTVKSLQNRYFDLPTRSFHPGTLRHLFCKKDSVPFMTLKMPLGDAL